MRRRAFIAGLAGSAVWPFNATAQRADIRVIGYLTTAGSRIDPVFRSGLEEEGFVEGRNVDIEFRTAEGRYDRLPELAAELVARKVALIFTSGSIGSAHAARTATSTIPIVFIIGADPVREGLVPSLSRPGGNVTGVTQISGVGGKQLSILRELVPSARALAVLVNPENPTHWVEKSQWDPIAKGIGIPIEIGTARSTSEFEPAIRSLGERRVGGVLVAADSVFGTNRRRLADVFARHAMPAIFSSPDFVQDGGLISYGGSRREAVRQAGLYAGRILRGEKPENMPVHQATKFELAINLKTASALGITVPDTLKALADEVIE